MSRLNNLTSGISIDDAIGFDNSGDVTPSPGGLVASIVHGIKWNARFLIRRS